MTSEYSVFRKIIGKIHLLFNRLFADIREISCTEIVKYVNRYEIMKKYIEKLSEELENYVRELDVVENILNKYIRLKSRIVHVSITLIFVIAGVMGLIVIVSPLETTPAHILYPYMPLLLTILGLSIVVLVVISTIALGYMDVKQDIRRNKRRRDELTKNIWKLRWRIDVLRRELEKSYEYKLLIRNYNLCKCFETYREIINILENIDGDLKKLREAGDRDNVSDILVGLTSYLSKLHGYIEVCHPVFTEEYYFTIECPENIEQLPVMVSEDLDRNDMKCRVVFRFSSIEYDLNLLKLIREFIEKQ